MGNSTSRVVQCFVPIQNGKGRVDLEFLEPLDEGLGHSFCYVRPMITDSPTITASNSERFTVDSSTLDSETQSGSFRRELVEDSLGLLRPIKNFPETTFKTISGASVSANVLTARSGNQNAVFMSDAQEPAAAFESTSSFAAIPLQPVPRGSGPLNGFLSGPLERGFASGPLDGGAGFMSGPIEKGVFMLDPLEGVDRTNFSAPLVYSRRRTGFGRVVRSMSRPMRNALSRTFVSHSSGSGWMQRFFLHPVTRLMWHPKEGKFQPEVPRSCFEDGPPVGEYSTNRNLQWAHGKAGEDRVHVVLSEEQGWLFVGIYDGFSGPDAPDFLMRNLYRAIDKELEGLLWDCEDRCVDNRPLLGLVEKDNVRTTSDCQKEYCVIAQSCGDGLEQPHTAPAMDFELNEDGNDKQSRVEKTSVVESVEVDEIAEEKHEDGTELQSAKETNKDLSIDTGIRNMEMAGPSGFLKQVAFSVSTAQLAGHGRKSKRLYELLGMEDWNIQDSLSVSEIGSVRRRRSSWDLQPNGEYLNSREKLPEARPMSRSISTQGDQSSCLGEDVSSREGEGVVGEGSKHGIAASFPISGQKQLKRSLIGSKLKNVCRKQISLRKKLFPWSYDWHRYDARVDKIAGDSFPPLRRCKSGPVDHAAVMSAMSRALHTTEDAYMEMVEKALDKNPELALMGSCVLVMLMKDQDVYVMNLGDSRVILAQEGPDDIHDDAGHRNKSRESLTRVELDRISEESPMHNQTSGASNISKSRGISTCRLNMRAVQLSTDHSTSIEEEVLRVRSEHADDSQAMLNDRVKGQLKVTRAFGAGFLKKPKCNEALLQMFRIEYIGTSPYLSCIPSVRHHRLSSNDQFLVLSSDGLYQYFSNEEVVSHVAWFMENIPDGDPAQNLIAELLSRAAKKNGWFMAFASVPFAS
ncbi:protein phosphatase 2C 32-like isoform X2 [Magnolia sinica]|uniref:protein phosphatase 2C 32-like isoform X2 n=1 Tax=Magnolia sinica TaxID=86752 RepID=UPI00265AA4F1|nr:protein phosphatase 2C 32-like isoform X2 [Magnolia sinica]